MVCDGGRGHPSAAVGVPAQSACMTIPWACISRGHVMLRVVGHEDFDHRLDALTPALVGGVLVKPVGKVKGGLVGLESSHMLCRGLKGHDVLDPTLKP